MGSEAYGLNWFVPVTSEEVQAAEKRLGQMFPQPLRQFYLEIGAGFLRTSRNGTSVHNHPNRFIYPEEVVALRFGESELTPQEGFDRGELPMFEVGDQVFLVMRPEDLKPGAVFWSHGREVEDDFRTFVRRMYFEEPRYYTRELRR